MMLVGVALMLTGVVLPLLMVVKVLESTFLLNFLSYAASLGGMFLSFLGMFSLVRGRHK